MSEDHEATMPELEPTTLDLAQRLGTALALGLLIGIERGWQKRGEQEGARVAGVRTYGLIGLFGGISAVLAEQLGLWIMASGFGALALLIAVGYGVSAHMRHDYGITSAVAALITFAVGALCALGILDIAAAVGVVTFGLLTMKPVLHDWVARLRREELVAAMQLLLISLVALPLLPDKGYGPWNALNPYKIWLMVVLIAAIGFTGYAAVRIFGARLGLLLTALAAGLASSTALTLNYARLGRRQRDLASTLSAGIVIAAATMLPRLVVLVSAINLAILRDVAAPLLAMAAAGFIAGLALWLRSRRDGAPGHGWLSNPLDLKSAVQFGALLAAIALAANAAREWAGDAGIYLLSLVSGIADTDAITLSLAELARGGITAQLATQGIVIAAVTNTAVKLGMVVAIGGRGMAVPAIAGMAPMIAVGVAALFLA